MKKTLLLFGIIITFIYSCDKEESFIPKPVELLSPKFGELDQPLNPILEWVNPNTENLHYHYDIYLGTSRNNVELVDTNIAKSWKYENPRYECNALEKNTKYYWMIRIKTDNQYSDSEISEFVTTNKLPSIKFHNSTIMVYPSDNSYLRSDTLHQYIRYELSGATNWTDGHLNTLALVKDYEKYHKEGMYMAAKHCFDLIAYGYSDWYLPSVVELDSIDSHFELVKLSNDIYWTSNEYEKDANFGHTIEWYLPPSNLDNPYNIRNKLGHHKCRCIRKE